MKKTVNRKALVLSAILTILVLAGVGTVVFAANPPAASVNRSQAVVATTQQAVSAGQTLTSDQAAAQIAAYKTQLAQAYQALDQAYAQINALQAAQGRSAVRPARPEQGQSLGGGITSQGTRNHD